MGIPDVMHQAMKAYEPIERNKVLAIRAAIHAVEQQVIPNAAVDASSFDREKLLNAALEVWSLYVRVSTSKLLSKEIREQLPSLYSQEHEADPLVICKFFTPDSSWTWYAYEFDGLDTFFGYVVGQEQELGYFTLHELETNRGPLGAAIERDEHFTPTRLSEIRKQHNDEVVPIMLVLVDQELGEPGEEELDDFEVKPFFITSVTRSDLQELGATNDQVAALTDEDMQAIAREMEDLYVERSFWDDLRATANNRLAQKGLANIPVEDEKDDEAEA